MNKRFSYDNMIKSKSIEPNDLIRTYKLDRCCDFMELKYNNPRMTQKQICNQLGFSDSTIKDIEMILKWIDLIEEILIKGKKLINYQIL